MICSFIFKRNYICFLIEFNVNVMTSFTRFSTFAWVQPWIGGCPGTMSGSGSWSRKYPGLGPGPGVKATDSREREKICETVPLLKSRGTTNPDISGHFTGLSRGTSGTPTKNLETVPSRPLPIPRCNSAHMGVRNNFGKFEIYMRFSGLRPSFSNSFVISIIIFI